MLFRSLKNPYITYENNYIESLWWALKQLYDKGLLYEGYTIQPYSPAAGTGLSTHELNQPGCYRMVKDTSAVAQFKIAEGQKTKSGEDVSGNFFLAWTTTPWTLPSNTALTVGGEIEYSLIETFNPYTALPVKVILAKVLVGKYFDSNFQNAEMKFEAGKKELPWKEIKTFKGKDLEGIRYEQLLP